MKRVAKWLIGRLAPRLLSELAEQAIDGKMEQRFPAVIDELVERRAMERADELLAEFWRDVAPVVGAEPGSTHADRLLGMLQEVAKGCYLIGSELEKLRAGDTERSLK